MENRDLVLFIAGGFMSLDHAHNFRRAQHIAGQSYSRRMKSLQRSLAANLAMINAGHGLLLDLPGGYREIKKEMQTAARRRDAYVSTYGAA